MQIECPTCDKALEIPDQYAGKKVRCPACKNPMLVPELDEVAPEMVAPGPVEPEIPDFGGGGSSVGGAAANPFAGVADDGGGGAPGPAPGPAAAGPAAPIRTERRRYPALSTAANLYAVVAWIFLGLGGLGALVALVVGFMAMGDSGLMGLAFVLFQVVIVLLYTFLLFISLKAASEFIHLAKNVEHDNHVTADAVRRLVDVMSDGR